MTPAGGSRAAAGELSSLKGKKKGGACVYACVRALTCSKQNDLVIKGKFRKMRDPLGPLH